MSLQHSPAGKTDKQIITVCAAAVRSLEWPSGFWMPLDISKEDDAALTEAKSLLWGIIERNGYTIDVDTNRVTKAIKP